MDLGSKYFEIKQFLSISDENFNLDQKIENNFDSDNLKIEILGKIVQFIYYFSMFKNIKPFMNSVYNCIDSTLDLRTESVNDFKELLIKNTLMRFIQDYIDYAQLTQKTQILRLFSDSLDKLQIQPLIINLGLLLKPMYQDHEYIDRANKFQEVEISYSLNDEIEVKLKDAIDKWLKTQTINLDNQDSLKTNLKNRYDTLATEYSITKGSEFYQKLSTEIMEMLSMKLTMISLMDSMSNESFEPIPIKSSL